MNFCHFWKFTDTLQWCFTTGKHFWATQTTTRTTQTDRQNKKNPAIPGGQEVGPDVEGLIGELEEAEDAVGG